MGSNSESSKYYNFKVMLTLNDLRDSATIMFYWWWQKVIGNFNNYYLLAILLNEGKLEELLKVSENKEVIFSKSPGPPEFYP